MAAKRIDSWVVSNEFWARVEPLVPKRVSVTRKTYVRPKPGAGRPPKPALVTAASVNDGKRIEEVLLAIVVKRKRTPLRRSKHLCADAGYRSAEALRIIDSHGYIPHVVDRRQEAAAKQRQPWKAGAALGCRGLP
jgi:hypothetical protein